LLAGSILTTILASSAFGSHKTGDFPLPDLIAPGDYNKDGNLDLAVNISGFDNIAILEGNGKGDFTITEHVETDTLPKGLAVGYVNKDDNLDLVSICKWGYSIGIYLGDGLGGFVQANELKGDGEPTRISLYDINNDGNLDLVANAPDEGKMLIYFGLGSGGFSNSPLEIEDLGNDNVFAVGDFNNDGKLDLATLKLSDGETSSVIILLGNGSGGFAKTSRYTLNSSAAAISLADLNHDGNLDFVVAGSGPEDNSGLFLSSYLGDGTGNFVEKQAKGLGHGALEGILGLGDFNEDGNIDLAFPITFSQGTTRSTTVLTFLGDGAGNLAQGQSITVGEGPHSALAADFNHDGHLDLAVTNRTAGTLSILLGDGSGTFTTHATLTVANLPQL
jgi:hypothetical protein